MTIPDLISILLEQLRSGFYSERPPRDFKRDERALTKAIARWGYECARRGWDFTPDFIYRDISELLIQIKRTDADIGYLPVYLDGAIRRRIGLRAEELQREARRLSPIADRLIKRVDQVEAIREPTTTEVLGKLFIEMKRAGRKKKFTPARQQNLFCNEKLKHGGE